MALCSRRFGALSAVACLLALGACSGGGGGAAPAAVDLTGYWQLWLTPSGGEETGPSCVYLQQTGNSIDGAEITGSVSGYSLQVTAVAQAFTIALQGVATTNSASGTVAISGLITADGTFRMDRFTPAGTATIDGTIGSIDVALDLATAAGQRIYSDAARTVLTEVEVVAAIGSQHCEISFDPSGLVVGALAVPATLAVNVTWRDDANELDVDADGGTVTITRYDGSGIAGSYSLSLAGGGSLTGTFDVSWDLESYSP